MIALDTDSDTYRALAFLGYQAAATLAECRDMAAKMEAASPADHGLAFALAGLNIACWLELARDRPEWADQYVSAGRNLGGDILGIPRSWASIDDFRAAFDENLAKFSACLFHGGAPQ